VPGSSYCRKCFIDIDEVVEVKDTGKIGTFTVNLADVRGKKLERPTVVCQVQLDGASSWLTGMLRGIEWEKVRVGMKVRVVWREKTSGYLGDIHYFEPIEQ
jgi:hypothetical protein